MQSNACGCGLGTSVVAILHGGGISTQGWYSVARYDNRMITVCTEQCLTLSSVEASHVWKCPWDRAVAARRCASVNLKLIQTVESCLLCSDGSKWLFRNPASSILPVPLEFPKVWRERKHFSTPCSRELTSISSHVVLKTKTIWIYFWKKAVSKSPFADRKPVSSMC